MTPLWASLVFTIQTIPAVPWFQTHVRSRNKPMFWAVRSQKNEFTFWSWVKHRFQRCRHQGGKQCTESRWVESKTGNSSCIWVSQKSINGQQPRDCFYRLFLPCSTNWDTWTITVTHFLQSVRHCISLLLLSQKQMGAHRKLIKEESPTPLISKAPLSGSFLYEAHIEMGISSIQCQEPQKGELHYHGARNSEQRPV